MNRLRLVEGLGLVDAGSPFADLDSSFSGLPPDEDLGDLREYADVLRPYVKRPGSGNVIFPPSTGVQVDIYALIDDVFPVRRGKEKQSGSVYRTRRWLLIFLEGLPPNKIPQTPEKARKLFEKRRDELRAQAKAVVDTQYPCRPGDTKYNVWRKNKVDSELDRIFSRLAKQGAVVAKH